MSGLYQVFAMLIDYQMVLNGVELIPGHYTHKRMCTKMHTHYFEERILEMRLMDQSLSVWSRNKDKHIIF